MRRAIDEATAPQRAEIYGLVEWEEIAAVTNGDGGAPSATTGEGEQVQVLETYGLATRPQGSGSSLCLAPGADDTNRVALGVSSPGGRPATDGGDSVLYSANGHEVRLDDDGDLTITGKDGASIVLAVDGSITIDAGPAAGITINVDGGQVANLGDALAVAMLKAQAAENFLVAAAQGITSPDPNVEAAFTAFGAALAGLATAAGTTKAMGT